jgi:hypothetical protein
VILTRLRAAAGCACAFGVAWWIAATLVAQTRTVQRPTTSASQPANPRAGASASYRTPWGDPDLQGVWNFGTGTPLERPKELEGKTHFTPEEAAEYERRVKERSDADNRDGTPEQDVARAYNEFWWEHGTRMQADLRTSLVIDPPDGKVPPLTPEATQRQAAARQLNRQLETPQYTSYKEMTTRDRCLIYRPLPPLPTNNNNNFEIVQGPGWVGIVQEEIHETRIIPLDGRPHLASAVGQWLGDSRGHWEGNTLVVETTNFNGEVDFRGSREHLHLIERWTRAASDRIEYEFTVTDPTTWTRPWTAAINYWRNDSGMFEYACHEGNYALPHTLEGQRNLEKGAADAAKKGSK